MPSLVSWDRGDALYVQLVRLADPFDGSPEGSGQEAVRYALTESIDGYQSLQWPDSKPLEGKG